MAPIYEDETTTIEKLYEMRKKKRCQVCHGPLDVFLDVDRGKAFLACQDWRRTHHEGVERVAQPPFEPNIPTRRRDMVEELGEEKATKLKKYEGVVSLSQAQAMEVLQTIWPEAPEVEVLKAGMVCHQYGLNPLMRQVFLIPFKRRDKQGRVIGEDWVTVLGIKANRLIAHRSGGFSYLDDTPRIMTDEEQKRIFGEVDNSRIWAITKLRDSKGNEAAGYGSWPKGEEPYGTEKGNTKANMAFIRSERNALDRLFPGEMPQGVEVIDEEYAAEAALTGAEGGEERGTAIEAATGQKETIGGEQQQVMVPRSSPPKQEVKTKRTASAPPAEAEAKSPDEVTEEDIPDLNALCRACFFFWKLQPHQVWKELGYKSQLEVAESAWECFQRIRALRAEN